MAMSWANRSPIRPGRLSPSSGPVLQPAFVTAVSAQGVGQSAFSQRLDYILQKQDCCRAYSPTFTPDLLVGEEEESLFPALFETNRSPSSRLDAPQWRKYVASLQQSRQREGFPLHNAALRGACQVLPVPRLSPKPLSGRAQSHPIKPARSPDLAFPASLPLCIGVSGGRNRKYHPVRRGRRRETEGFADSKLLTRTVTRIV